MKYITILIMALSLYGCDEHYQGTVTGKQYTPATYGTGITSNGKLVSTSTDAQYSVELDGGASDFEVDHLYYKKLKLGDVIDYHRHFWTSEMMISRGGSVVFDNEKTP